MTGDKPRYHLMTDNILFLSVPLCVLLGVMKFESSNKVIGLCLFVFVFCIIYKLYVKITNYKSNYHDTDVIRSILSAIGFMSTIGLGIFAESQYFRWLFLIGIILSATFSDIVSALVSTFTYILIIIMFTGVTPEFVTCTLFTAIIIIIITQYYSDFVSVIYSITTVISFEVAFYIIMHGLRTDRLITASHVIEAGIISGSILLGWLLFKSNGKKRILSENSEIKVKADDEAIDVKEALLDNVKYSSEKVTVKDIEPEKESQEKVDKDYSYLLCDKVEVYKKMVSNKVVFKEAKRNSKFVKEITELIEGNTSLAEVGAFYAECGRTVSNNYIKEGLILAKNNNFPSEVTAFIKEHNFKVGYPKSRETAITMMVSKLSATIGFLESKKIMRSVTQVVDSVMDSCLMAGRLDTSGLSLNEYKFIKDYLLEEARTGYDYFSGKRD